MDDRPAGCVALRRINDEVCELKRLYVLAEFRGQKIGRMLAESIPDESRGISYRRMRLGTLPSMKEAQALYRS